MLTLETEGHDHAMRAPDEGHLILPKPLLELHQGLLTHLGVDVGQANLKRQCRERETFF